MSEWLLPYSLAWYQKDLGMRLKSIWQQLLWLAIVLLLFNLSVNSAFAHANLIRSTPNIGEVLATAPTLVELEFSEAVDPNFFTINLLNDRSQVVVSGPGSLDSVSPHILRLELPSLPDGAYTISWKVRSAVDGHLTNGIVGFSIGLKSPRASLLPPPGEPDPAYTLPTPLETTARWGSYLFTTLLAGSLFFWLLVWKPVLSETANDVLVRSTSVIRLLKRLAWAGVLGTALSAILLFFFQILQVVEISPESPFQLLSLVSGRGATLLGGRLGILALTAWMIQRSPEDPISTDNPWWWAAGFTMAVLLTFSLQSHSAASGSILAIVMDWIHRTAVSIWIGGLVPLVFLLSRADRKESAFSNFAYLIPRFSRVAIFSVVLISISGFYSANLHIRTLEALLYTSYGRALLFKVGLFVILITLGAINLLVLSPRLSQSVLQAIKGLNRTVRAEICLGVLVLIAAGVMAGASPAYEILQSQKRMGFMEERRTEGVDIKLYVVPARVGENELGIDIRDRRSGKTLIEDSAFLVRFTAPDPNLGVFQKEAIPSDDGRFSVRGAYFSMIGDWQVEVIFRQAGKNDVRYVFEVPIRISIEGDIDHSHHTAPDASSIAKGLELYQANCLPCHGPEGKGDGPVGLALNPPPSALSEHVAPGVHPDEQLFEWISEGYPGSVMPAFKDLLTEEERWHLVNYIRTLYP